MYWYRFRLEGARVRVKVWTAEEPLGWQINLVDPDPYLVAGRPFWSVQTSVASALYYDLASAVLYDSTSWLSGNVALQPTLVEHPFVITVFDKAFTRQGWVSNPVYCTFTPRFNAMGTGEIQVAADDPIVEALSDEGARIRVEYRDAHLLSGPVRAIQGEFVAGGTVTYQVEEDWRELDNLAWVRPGNVITPTELTATAPGWLAQTTLPGGGGDAGADGTTQGQYEYFFWPDGSAAAGGVLVSYSESAIKLLISANSVTRLGRPLTVATDLARGGDARAADELPEVRFSTIAEGIAPILEWSGLGLKLWHDGVTPTIHVDVFEPGEWLQELTVESGIIANGTWSLSYPEATRAVVGGPGEGPARAFSEVITALGFETTYNDVREVFTDATGFKLVWPDALADELRVAKGFLLQPTVPSIRKTRFTNYLARAGRAAIVEGKPTGGVSIELSETESFYFGGAEGVQLGDTVTAVSGGQRFTDRITEASLSWDATDGLTVTPRVGVRDDDPNKAFVAALRRVADSLSRQSKAK
jgi:hypothetical protein